MNFPLLLMDNKYANHLSREPTNEKKKHFKEATNLYLIYNLSIKAFKSIVLNRALTSSHGGLLEITLTVPL